MKSAGTIKKPGTWIPKTVAMNSRRQNAAGSLAIGNIRLFADKIFSY